MHSSWSYALLSQVIPLHCLHFVVVFVVDLGDPLLGELHILWASPLKIRNIPVVGTVHSTIFSLLNWRSLCFPSCLSKNEFCGAKWQHIRTWSLSLSWWPMIAVAWWGYFCFRCSRKASLFLSISDVCIPRISLELRGPPRVCLLGMFREALETKIRLFPLARRSLVLRHSASSNDVTCRLLFPCSERPKKKKTTKIKFTINDFTLEFHCQNTKFVAAVNVWI